MRYFIVFGLYNQTDRDLSTYGSVVRQEYLAVPEFPNMDMLNEIMFDKTWSKFVGITGLFEITGQEYHSEMKRQRGEK